MSVAGVAPSRHGGAGGKATTAVTSCKTENVAPRLFLQEEAKVQTSPTGAKHIKIHSLQCH